MYINWLVPSLKMECSNKANISIAFMHQDDLCVSRDEKTFKCIHFLFKYVVLSTQKSLSISENSMNKQVTRDGRNLPVNHTRMETEIPTTPKI